jgi:DNA-binding NtrC family response regulator
MVEAPRKRILVVDDEIEICHILENLFSLAGFDVVQAYGGFEAISLCRIDDFSLIVTDFTMPRIGGAYYMECLRSHALETPIIVFSGASDNAEVLIRMSGIPGIVAVFDKMCDPADLISSAIAATT